MIALNSIASNMTIDNERSQMSYKVISISIYGGQMEYEFDTLQEAQSKVRELKDPNTMSAFIVKPIVETIS
jgi:hypothetical protein